LASASVKKTFSQIQPKMMFLSNVCSRDVVVKMDVTSSDSNYDSDIDWIDDSDFEFIEDAEETIFKGIKLFF